MPPWLPSGTCPDHTSSWNALFESDSTPTLIKQVKKRESLKCRVVHTSICSLPPSGPLTWEEKLITRLFQLFCIILSVLFPFVLVSPVGKIQTPHLNTCTSQVFSPFPPFHSRSIQTCQLTVKTHIWNKEACRRSSCNPPPEISPRHLRYCLDCGLLLWHASIGRETGSTSDVTIWQLIKVRALQY